MTIYSSSSSDHSTIVIFGTTPQLAHYSQCHVDVVTTIDHEKVVKTWLFRDNSCKDVHFKCSICKQLLVSISVNKWTQMDDVKDHRMDNLYYN